MVSQLMLTKNVWLWWITGRWCVLFFLYRDFFFFFVLHWRRVFPFVSFVSSYFRWGMHFSIKELKIKKNSSFKFVKYFPPPTSRTNGLLNLIGMCAYARARVYVRMCVYACVYEYVQVHGRMWCVTRRQYQVINRHCIMVL